MFGALWRATRTCADVALFDDVVGDVEISVAHLLRLIARRAAGIYDDEHQVRICEITPNVCTGSSEAERRGAFISGRHNKL